MYNGVWCFCIYPYRFSLNGWHILFCIKNNRHDVTIATHAVQSHFPIWMTMVRQPSMFLCFNHKIHLYLFNWWTRQRIHNTLIVDDRYLRLTGDKTIPDSVEPRLESFYPPFVADIDLPHQGVVDSYNPEYSIPWLLMTWYCAMVLRYFQYQKVGIGFMGVLKPVSGAVSI